jgi:protocatechuate 4,5-dioxygenase alpha chain
LSEEQKQAVLDRDYNRVIELGGNVYFFSKLFFTDQKSFELGAAAMTGMSPEQYRNMMLSGGRSIEGNRYKEKED